MLPVDLLERFVYPWATGVFKNTRILIVMLRARWRGALRELAAHPRRGIALETGHRPHHRGDRPDWVTRIDGFGPGLGGFVRRGVMQASISDG